MIIKIKTLNRPNFRKLLEYMIHDKDRLFDKDGKSFVITHNLKGSSIPEWVDQYRANESCRQRKRTDSVYLTHEIISWHREDAKHITLAKMEEMAREYLRLRNPNGMYVAVPHFDRDHYHIHVCASGIEYRTGKSLRLPKKDLQELKKRIQDYQIRYFPELSRSIVRHGIKKAQALSTDKEYQYKLRTGRATEKEYIAGILKTCYERSRSEEDFFRRLNESGLQTYIRGKKITGILYKNKKYRLKQMGFGKEFLEQLNKTLEREDEINRAKEKNNRKYIDKNI